MVKITYVRIWAVFPPKVPGGTRSMGTFRPFLPTLGRPGNISAVFPPNVPAIGTFGAARSAAKGAKTSLVYRNVTHSHQRRQNITGLPKRHSFPSKAALVPFLYFLNSSVHSAVYTALYTAECTVPFNNTVQSPRPSSRVTESSNTR